VAGLVAKLVMLSITASDAAAKQRILLQATTGSAAAAGELGAMVDRVARRSPQAAGEIAKIAESLYKAGKRGEELEAAIASASYEASGLGKNPGPELVAARMGNLDVAAVKFRERIQSLFAGAATQKSMASFSKSMSTVLDLFDSTTTEGNGLQALLRSLVDPLVKALGGLGPAFKAAFRGGILVSLQMAIAVLKVAIAVKKLDKELKLSDKVDLLTLAFYAGAAVAIVFAVALGLLALGIVIVAALIAAVVVTALMFFALFLLIPIVILAVAVALAVVLAIAIAKAIAWFASLVASAKTAATGLATAVKDGIAKAVAFLGTLATAGKTAATNMIAGLVAGITSGATQVGAAMKKMATDAISTLKSALKISSPSKVFESFGGYTAEGFALGVEGGTDGVGAALQGMASMPDGPEGGGRAAGGVGDVTINVTAPGGDADEIARVVRDVLLRLLEGDAIAAGGAA
jgi:hypothetical protein